MGIYVASKAKHGGDWKQMRDEMKVPVCSTWINQYEPGQTKDWSQLWIDCINEATNCDVLVAILRHKDEVPKGVLIEIGAALANNRPVYAVGFDDYSFINHPVITSFPTEYEAFVSAMKLIGTEVPKLYQGEVA